MTADLGESFMTKDQLIKKYPKLYHVAEAGSWPSIQKHGLLSTSALLDLFEIYGPKRKRFESKWRGDSMPIEHPVHGKAVIRDQKPMPPDKLSDLLIDLTPCQWYELINGKTFFWAQEQHLYNFLIAKEYRDRVHWVITVDTAGLLERYSQNITLSRINTGFVYCGRKRGTKTLKTISNFPGNNKVLELAVDYSIPEIVDITLIVEECYRRNKIKTIWLP